MSTAAPLQNTVAQSPLVSNSSHAGLLLQRKCACGGAASSSLSGECEECNKKRLQKKLSIGASNDPLEQEADRVADQVLAAPAHSAVSSATPGIQRFTGQSTGDAGTAPASVDRVLAGSGRPLDVAIQQDMGQRFGHDFSRVRVHTDAHAAKSVREVNALAFTVGRDIVFGEGQYAPHSIAGQRLLAHELTHTIQQGGHATLMPSTLVVGAANNSYEQEADRVANQIMAVPPHSADDGERGLDTTASFRTEPLQIARQLATPTSADVAEPRRPVFSGEPGATPMSEGPGCSRSRGRGQSLPLANTAFRGERGFAYIPSDGHPGPGGLLVTGNSVSIRISAHWEEQITDPAQRPPDQRNRRADRPQYYLSFSGWVDDCDVSRAGTPASSVQSGNLTIGTEHTVSLASLIPGRYGLHINPSTASAEPNRVLTGNCEVT